MGVGTAHFSSEEYLRGGGWTAPGHGLAAQSVLTVAELVRSAWGPLRVTSGYRPLDTESQHGRGEAVDLVPVSVDRLQVAAWLWDLAHNPDYPKRLVMYDQLIVYSNTFHLHLSWSVDSPQRGQFLVGTPSKRAGKRWDYAEVPESGYAGPLALELRRLGVSL